MKLFSLHPFNATAVPRFDLDLTRVVIFAIFIQFRAAMSKCNEPRANQGGALVILETHQANAINSEPFNLMSLSISRAGTCAIRSELDMKSGGGIIIRCPGGGGCWVEIPPSLPSSLPPFPPPPTPLGDALPGCDVASFSRPKLFRHLLSFGLFFLVGGEEEEEEEELKRMKRIGFFS